MSATIKDFAEAYRAERVAEQERRVAKQSAQIARRGRAMRAIVDAWGIGEALRLDFENISHDVQTENVTVPGHVPLPWFEEEVTVVALVSIPMQRSQSALHPGGRRNNDHLHPARSRHKSALVGRNRIRLLAE